MLCITETKVLTYALLTQDLMRLENRDLPKYENKTNDYKETVVT